MQTFPDSETVALERLAQFVRQLSHDVRNGLNALDLQAVLLEEMTEDKESTGDIRRMRSTISEITKSLQQVSAKFAPLSLHTVPAPAAMLTEQIEARTSKRFAEMALQIEWRAEPGEARLAVDFDQIEWVFGELFQNAFQFRDSQEPIVFTGREEQGRMIFEVREPKAQPVAIEGAGIEPLSSTRRGRYGLGLFHARRIISSHGGEFGVNYDPKTRTLVTQISLPTIS